MLRVWLELKCFGCELEPKRGGCEPPVIAAAAS
jgi:hypothetical protein